MNSTERNGLRTWIEVDRRAIRHNVNVFRSLIPKGTKLMAVVKSNAYGHSLIDFSKEMERIGADFLCVDSIVEALALRHEGIHTPILVLGYTVPELFSEAVKNDISLTGSTFETLRAIEKTKLPRPLRVHIKVDSGMHRQGFLLSDLPRIVSILKSKILNHKSSSILIEGLYTHFANAKNPAFPKDTENQLDEFRKWIAAFKKSGLCPAPEVREAYKDRVALAPALTWKSLVTEIKKLPAGSRVGYDLAETLAHNSIIAVVPIGYWHGYPRALSSIGRVMVKGRESKVIGRVSMDMLTVDVSDVATPRVGDDVVVMGGSDVLPVSAAGLSRALDASWYEVVARLNPLIKRIYK